MTNSSDTIKLEDIVGTSSIDNFISLFENVTKELDDAHENLTMLQGDIGDQTAELKELLERDVPEGEDNEFKIPEKDKELGYSVKKEYEFLKDWTNTNVKDQFSLPSKPDHGVNLCLNCQIYFRQKREDGDNHLFM